jgi:hypothetical protein
MLIDAVLARRFRVVEVAIPTRYTEESSSASVSNSLKYVLSTIWLAGRARFRRPRAKQVTPES